MSVGIGSVLVEAQPCDSEHYPKTKTTYIRSYKVPPLSDSNSSLNTDHFSFDCPTPIQTCTLCSGLGGFCRRLGFLICFGFGHCSFGFYLGCLGLLRSKHWEHDGWQNFRWEGRVRWQLEHTSFGSCLILEKPLQKEPERKTSSPSKPHPTTQTTRNKNRVQQNIDAIELASAITG